jgi:pyruvate/2-oxoglutarate dehydrogenase complex dihydrolipoamide acyltransferase (E2) component
MRAYPLLNGYFKDGCAIRHSDVNGGLAMDRGGQLVVCGIRNTDTISLPDLRTVMDSAVSRYMDDRLTSAEMQRATFTVSDLSSSGIDFMFPLLPKGQSLILGITRDGLGVFTLFAGFDHRMTEGLEVSRFLTDLRTRLQSFDDLTPALSEAGLHCHYCKDSLQDAQARSKQRGLLKLTISPTKEVLCCGSCWNGW